MQERRTGPRGPKRTNKRPTPRWLTEKQDLDEMGRRRCLMVLSVLSGERTVTEVVEEADISRQMYFDLETRGLQGMLTALVPGSDASTSTRLEELEQQVVELERGKRRAEKLLELTRKVVRAGPMKAAPGRPRGKRRSTKSGSAPSASSKAKSTSATTAPASSPTTDGADVR